MIAADIRQSFRDRICDYCESIVFDLVFLVYEIQYNKIYKFLY